MINVPIPKTNADLDMSLHITKSTENCPNNAKIERILLKRLIKKKLKRNKIFPEIKSHLDFAVWYGFLGSSDIH